MSDFYENVERLDRLKNKAKPNRSDYKELGGR
jgi:hypothetical protein